MRLLKKLLTNILLNKRPITIAVSYFILGSLWIIITDQLIIVYDDTIELIEQMQYYKGQLFIIITTIILFIIVNNDTTKVRKSLEILELSEEKYRRLFDETMDMIIVTEAESGIIVDCNKRTEIITGNSKKDLIGKPEKYLYPSSDHVGRFSRSYHEHLYIDITKRLESQILDSSGNLIDVSIKASEIRIDDKLFLQCVLRDIRNRKKPAAIIKEHSSLLEALLRTTKEGLWVVDNNGKILMVNDAYCRMSGYSKHEIMNLSIHQIEAKETPEEVEKHIQKIIERGWDRFESRHRRKDGTIFDVEISISFDKIRSEYYAYIQNITEEKRIKNELKLFMEAVEYSSDVIGMSTPQGKHYYQNKAFNKLFGDVGNYPPSKIFVDQSIGNEVFTTIMGGCKWQGEVKMYNANKEVIDIFLRAYPVFDENGNISALVGIHTDITEKKVFEEKLRISEKRYRNFFEKDISGDYLSTPEGKLLDCNIAFARMMGYETVDDILKVDTYSFYRLPEKRHQFLSELNEKKTLINKEFELIRKDGVEIHSIENIIGNFNDEGVLIEIQGYAVDITQRKKLEREIENHQKQLENIVEERTRELIISEEKYRVLAENSEDAIMRFDENCRLIYVNPAVEKLIGFPIEEFIRKTLKELNLPGDLVDDWNTTLANVIKSGISERVEFQLPNGKWIDMLLAPEFEENGEVKSVVTSARDITDSKDYENRIEKALVKEKELNDLKTKFISTASHEFRTPLATILSSVQMIKRFSKVWSEDEIIEQYDTINEAVKYITELLDNVLMISKNENSDYSIQFEIIELNNYFREIVQDHMALLKTGQKITAIHNVHNINVKVDKKC